MAPIRTRLRDTPKSAVTTSPRQPGAIGKGDRAANRRVTLIVYSGRQTALRTLVIPRPIARIHHVITRHDQKHFAVREKEDYDCTFDDLQ